VLADAWVDVAGRLAGAGASPTWIDDTRHALFEGTARTVYELPG
jgi:hypothetical protein